MDRARSLQDETGGRKQGRKNRQNSRQIPGPARESAIDHKGREARETMKTRKPVKVQIMYAQNLFVTASHPSPDYRLARLLYQATFPDKDKASRHPGFRYLDRHFRKADCNI